MSPQHQVQPPMIRSLVSLSIDTSDVVVGVEVEVVVVAERGTTVWDVVNNNNNRSSSNKKFSRRSNNNNRSSKRRRRRRMQ